MNIPSGVDSRELIVIARAVCTEKQFQVVQLREAGKGWKASALILGVGPDTVRDHYRAALIKITREVDRVEALRRDSAGAAGEAAREDGDGRAA